MIIKLYLEFFEGFDEAGVVLVVADGDAHVLFVGIKARLQATVARQDIMVSQHVDHDLLGRIGRQYLTEEIVGL